MYRIALLPLMLLAAGIATAGTPAEPSCTPAGEAQLEGRTVDRAYMIHVTHALHPDEEALAGHVCTGALSSYRWHHGEGFRSSDADGTLRYSLDDTTGSRLGSELDVRIAPSLVADAQRLGLNYSDPPSLYHVTVHHETNHHFTGSAVGCRDLTWWHNWAWLWNGYAAFSETLYAPAELHRPNSSFYEKAGANDYMAATNHPLTAYGHQTGLLHGYLYAHDGGPAFVHALAAAARGDCGGGDTLPRGVAYLDEALRATPGRHDDFETAFADFAVATVTRQDLTWGPTHAPATDWSEHLSPVTRADWTVPVHKGTVAPWGFEVIDGPSTGGSQVVLATTGHLHAFLLVSAQDVWHVQPFDVATHVPSGTHDDVAIVLVAPAQDPVPYTLLRAP